MVVGSFQYLGIQLIWATVKQGPASTADYRMGGLFLSFEPRHDKTNKMSMRPAKPGHPPSLISLRCPHEESLAP